MSRSISRSIVTFLLFIVTIGTAVAQVSLELPAAQNWTYWIGTEPLKSIPDSAQHIQEAKAILSTGALQPTDRLFVRDDRTGRLCIKPLDPTQKSITLKASDFDRIAEVDIRFTYSGKPIASANTKITQEKTVVDQLLSPSDKGLLKVYGLKVAPIRIQLTSKYNGTDVVSPEQIFDLKKFENTAVPSLEFALGSQVDVLAEEPAAQPADSQKSEKKNESKESSSPAPNPLGRAVVYGVGLAMAIAFGYLILRAVQKYQPQIDTQLSKVGVQIPKDNPEDDATSDASDPPAVPQAPKPQPQIVLDNATPTPIATAAPVSPVGTGQLGFRLANGDKRVLEDGVHLVSREPGSLLSFESEPSISRSHANVTVNGTVVTIKDLGSTNGTFVNGMKLTGESVIRPGDSIRFGSLSCTLEA